MKNITKSILILIVALLSLSAYAETLSVKKEVTVQAQPETVWKMIGNFNGLDVWHPVVVGSVITDGQSGVTGAMRLLTLENGATITEQLQSYSDTDKQYSYAIIESPLPVEAYQSTLSLSETEEGMTKITWQSEFQAKGVEDTEAVNAISGVYDAGLNHVQAMFK